MSAAALLEVRDLSVEFGTDDGTVRAVDGVGLAVEAGRTLAVVGESGSGKSVTALSILRLIPSPPGRIAGGRIVFRGRDLLGLSAAQMRAVRGNDIAMVFQDPMTALNPVLTIGVQIMEPLRLHQGLGRAAARGRAGELLREVGVGDAERRLDDYPHQLSGGLRQRVMIAMALACRPALLIADEPTTALDVTVQAQILDLMQEQQRALGSGILLITHDLGVVARMADRVAVMYAGPDRRGGAGRGRLRRPAPPLHLGPAGLDPQTRQRARPEAGADHRATRPPSSTRPRAARSTRAAAPAVRSAPRPCRRCARWAPAISPRAS